MSWNYRLVKHKDRYGDDWFAVHEAYYEDGEERPHSITKEPIDLGGESMEEVLDDLELIKKDILKYKDEILNYEDF